MTLRRLLIDNYRSIEHLDLPLGPMNAIIGPNNSGKSNILRALNLVLGETWPSRPFSERDLHLHDANRQVNIKVFFAGPLQADRSVHGFSLQGGTDTQPEYVPLDQNEAPCTWGGGRPKNVSKAMRAEVGLLYLDLERQADRQIRATQWTLYGKLLKEIETAIPAATKTAFRDAVTQAVEQNLRAGLTNAQTIIDNFVRRQTGLDVRLDFAALDSVEVLRGVRPYVHDAGMVSDPEDVGAGVQSALAVAVAKAYAEIVRQPLILALEEPELYLHPHGCRNFYKLLQELSAAGLQIIYTTHERSFVSAGEYEVINIVRKRGGVTEVTAGRNLPLGTQRQRLLLQGKFNERVNEAFFASAVVLVEGDADEIACRCALEREGIELDQKSVSVIGVGGRGEIPLISELLHGLGIPTFAVFDEDPGDPSTATTVANMQRMLGAGNVFLQRPNLEGLFGVPQKLTRLRAMALFPGWFAQMANAVPQVYVDLAAAVRAHV